MKNPHILLTTDFSEGSVRAFDPTLALARELGGKITLLHVVSEFKAVPHGAPLAPAQEPPGIGAEIEAATKELDEVRKKLGDDVPVTPAVEVGDKVDEVITEYADKHDVDLLAIASRGRTGIRRMVLGSVAESVLRRADKPVIVFPS